MVALMKMKFSAAVELTGGPKAGLKKYCCTTGTAWLFSNSRSSKLVSIMRQ